MLCLYKKSIKADRLLLFIKHVEFQYIYYELWQNHLKHGIMDIY